MLEPGASDTTHAAGRDAMFAALELMAGTADDAIAVTDLDARVHVWNPASERLFGIPATIALGRSIYELTESIMVFGGDLTDPRQAVLVLAKPFDVETAVSTVTELVEGGEGPRSRREPSPS